jgi:hypothetical protein
MKFHNFENSPFLMGKSTINGNFHSIAMFVYQRVTLKTFENSQECFTANHSMHVSFFGGWHCREKCLDIFVYFFKISVSPTPQKRNNKPWSMNH